MVIPRAAAAILLLTACSTTPAAQAPTVDLGGAAPPPAPAAPAPVASAEPAPRQARAKLSREELASLERTVEELDIQMLGVLDNQGAGAAPTSVLSAGSGPVGGLQLGGVPGAATVKGPTAAVSMGKVTVVGGVGNADPVAAGMVAGFRRCVNNALSSSPGSFKGRVVLQIGADLGPQGEVLRTRVMGSPAGIPPAAVSCVVARISAAQFEHPDGGAATLVIPIKIDVP